MYNNDICLNENNTVAQPISVNKQMSTNQPATSPIKACRPSTSTSIKNANNILKPIKENTPLASRPSTSYSPDYSKRFGKTTEIIHFNSLVPNESIILYKTYRI